MTYLLSLIYLYYNCDTMFLVDVNSRLGKKLDYIEGIHNILKDKSWMRPLINMGMYFLIFYWKVKCVYLMGELLNNLTILQVFL